MLDGPLPGNAALAIEFLKHNSREPRESGAQPAIFLWEENFRALTAQLCHDPFRPPESSSVHVGLRPPFLRRQDALPVFVPGCGSAGLGSVIKRMRPVIRRPRF